MAKFSRFHTRAAKLTAEQVLEIRRLYHQENFTQARLSRQFGVTEGTIGRIVRGTSWQSHGGPGEHLGAQEEANSKLLHDTALQNAALAGQGSASEEEIAASLARTQAKLSELGLTSGGTQDDQERSASDSEIQDGREGGLQEAKK